VTSPRVWAFFITGDLEQDSYENKEGVKVSRVQVNVNSITATTSTRRSDNEDATANAGGGGGVCYAGFANPCELSG